MGRIRGRDLAVSVVTGVLQVGVAVLASSHQHRSVQPIAIVLLCAGPLALLARRRHPAAVLGFTFAIALAYSASDYYPRGLVFIALVIACWTAMLSGRRRLGWISILAGYALFVAFLPLAGLQPGAGLAWGVGIAAWMLLLGTSAEIVRVRRERASEAELARAEQSRRIAGEERMLIARELHDALAHNISLINVQAGVALHLIDERPEHTRAALSAIKLASKDALRELRSVLDALKTPGEQPPLAPTAGLARLEQLLARTRDAGLPISASIEGTPTRLPPGVDLAAYRIIQEALTNVTRHAPGAPTEVHVNYGENALELEVDNHPLTEAAGVNGHMDGAGGGNGIPGMRERAGALGGSLDAGPRADGGFRVCARLPLATL
jgi:signal transduction histidine kinase